MSVRIVKRDGRLEECRFDKILDRVALAIEKTGSQSCDPVSIAKRVIEGIFDGVTSEQLDQLAAETAASMVSVHPDYSKVAAFISVTALHKTTDRDFQTVVSKLYHNVNPETGEAAPLVSKELLDLAKKYNSFINSHITFERDFHYDYFGFKTLERGYLLRSKGSIVERPQHMLMRVALGIHGDDINAAFETYKLMSLGYFTHATPTLFNAGTPRPQLASCFLMGVPEDSLESMYDSVKQAAMISKSAGGLGIHVHNIRAKGSYIKGTGGTSHGLVPYLRVLNDTARHCDQGGNKRKGAFAIYLEPWHGDIFEFLDLRKNQGKEEMRARDLFTALWIPDLFMERVEADAEWSLMCPDQSKGLSDCYGEEFKTLYEKYEAEGKFIKKVRARDLWFAILQSQIETGTPYMAYKDSFNSKSNQKNVGVIKSSNLCVAPETHILTDEGNFQIKDLVGQKVNIYNGEEFVEVVPVKTSDASLLVTVITDKFNHLNCTLYHKFILADGSRVPAHELQVGTILKDGQFITKIHMSGRIDETYCVYEPKLNQAVFNGILTGNCMEIAEVSTPDEIAVCNLASVSLPKFCSPENTLDKEALHATVKVMVKNLNRVIDRTYYPLPQTRNSNLKHRPIGLGVQGLADMLFKMAIPFESEDAKQLNREISEVIYHAAVEASLELAKQFGPYETFKGSPASDGILQFDMWGVTPSIYKDWDKIKEDIKVHGLRNSLLVAPMPTASTSQILGNNEAFEPITSNIYTRRVLSGEFTIINKYLVHDLVELGMWDERMRQTIINNNGSIQAIEGIPDNLKALYKTVWEISQKAIIDMAADRGAYVCQSQSMNLFVKDPNFAKIGAMHFYAWKKGLKTGMYYLRSQAATSAIKFTVDKTLIANKQEAEAEIACSLDNPGACEACSG